MASIIKVDQIQTAAGGTPTAADLGINTTGTVLQVVEVALTGQFNLTHASGGTTAWTDTGYSASITPTNSTSKILVEYDLPWYGSANTNVTIKWDTTLYVSGTALDTRPITSAYIANNTYIMPHGVYLHTHGTTSQITYNLYGQGQYATGGQYSINRGDHSRVRFTLTEIAG